ncbi:hypothetical protein [Treponema pedis]|uniref:hypothetical protein n=1 Tax=Treponema pedis TaxID=409322 RepID=UPI003D1945BC
MKILYAVMAVIIVITGGVLVYINLFGKFFGIEKEKLVSYQYSRSGDMLGSIYSKSVIEYNEDSALVTIVQRKQHNHKDTVREYLVDKEILDELKAVFVKYRIKGWDNKKFTNVFVADGASYKYSFDFETNCVSFSSQYYPEKYSSKLKEFDEIMAKYMENATLLPGLVISDAVVEADYEQFYKPKNGKIILSVDSYRQYYLYYRIANGTDEDRVIESVIRLYRDGESIPIYEKSFEYETTFFAHSSMNDSIKLKERLIPGKYRLEAFGYVTEFEIQ